MKSHILCALLVLFVLISSCENARRVKRKVVFLKNMKLFFRVNGKEPIVPWTNTFQHGWGFKASYILPDSVPKIHKLFRRDVSADIQEYFKQPELEVYLCTFKYLANILSSIEFGENCGVICKIADIFRRSEGDDLKFYRYILHSFRNYTGNCPNSNYELSFVND